MILIDHTLRSSPCCRQGQHTQHQTSVDGELDCLDELMKRSESRLQLTLRATTHSLNT
jgi:hypothetical protein